MNNLYDRGLHKKMRRRFDLHERWLSFRGKIDYESLPEEVQQEVDEMSRYVRDDHTRFLREEHIYFKTRLGIFLGEFPGKLERLKKVLGGI